MKILSHQAIAALSLAPNFWYEWVEYVLNNKHNFIMPPKNCIHFGESYYNTMPSILPEEQVMGVKVIHRFMNREPTVQSQLLLHDYRNGAFLALMDSSLITAMRTGAVAVHSIQTFANENFYEVGFMGYGNIGAAFLEIFFDHFVHKRMKVKILKYKNHADIIKQKYGSLENIIFEVVDHVEDIIKNSDVVISSISFTNSTLGKNEWFKEGCVIVPIHLRGFQNCDLFFDKVYGDDRGQVAGFKYYDKFKYFAETSEVLRGEAVGRESASERIICYSVGLSLHDIYAASQIYKIMEKSEDIETHDDLGPHTKIWL